MRSSCGKQVRRLPTSMGLAAGLGLGAFALAGGLAGCQRQLFAEEQFRTPFESYDRSLSQSTPTWVFDEYGTRRPNVRERLLAAERSR